MISYVLAIATGSLLAQPQTGVLNTPDKVWDVTVADLNRDGHGDIVLLCCDEKSAPLKKYVVVYLSDGGNYSEAGQIVHGLPEETGTAFFAEVDGAAPKELVAADGLGAQVYAFTGDGFREIAAPRFYSLWPSGAREPLFADNAAKDLDDDGVDEWLVPTPRGYSVRHAGREIHLVPCDVVSETRRSENTAIFHRLPPHNTFTLPGQSARGLAFLSDEFADFSYGQNWSEHKRFRVPFQLDDKWDASAKMADINNDGFPDLMVTQTKGTVNLQSTTQIYMAREPFLYADRPAATFDFKGAVSAPTLKDVNGDQLLDAIVITVPLGVKNIINYFVRGKVSVHAQVFLCKGNGFGSTPQFTQDLTLDAPEGRDQIAYKMEDFSGDGVLDLAFSKSANTLAVHTGDTASFLSKQPWVSLNLPSFGYLYACDLNGNAAKDIVLIHPAGDNAKRVDVIQF